MSKLRKKPVTKDEIWRINAESTQIHSFGLLDVLAKKLENFWCIPINFILLHVEDMRSCSRSAIDTSIMALA